MGSQHKESSPLKNDEPEVRDEISTPTFKYEIAYYTFHFKNSVNQRSNKMMVEDQATFKQICKKLCAATTVAMYHVLKGHLDEMAKKYEFLKPWIDWWHQRHSHIFRPFQRRWTSQCKFVRAG